MPIRKKDNHNWIFWLTLFILFCVGVYALKSVLLPFVAGIIIGYLLDPWASYFECKGLNRTVATLLVLFLVVIFLVPALIILFSIIDEQVGRFLETLPQLNRLFRNYNPVFQIWKQIKSKPTSAKIWQTASKLSALSFAASLAAALPSLT